MEKSNVSKKTFRDYDSYYAAFESLMSDINSEYERKVMLLARDVKVEQFKKILDWLNGHSVDTTPD